MGLKLYRQVFVFCAVLACLSGAHAEAQTNPIVMPGTLATRAFGSGEQSPRPDCEAALGFRTTALVGLCMGRLAGPPEIIWLAQSSEDITTDDERFTRTAIAYWIANDQYAAMSVYNEVTGMREKRPIKQYASVDEFLAQNPDCCRFGIKNSEGYWPSLWYRYRNNYAGLVTIRHILITYSDTGEVVQHSGREYAIDRDGNVIDETFWAD